MQPVKCSAATVSGSIAYSDTNLCLVTLHMVDLVPRLDLNPIGSCLVDISLSPRIHFVRLSYENLTSNSALQLYAVFRVTTLRTL